jgi:hypothetical protein
MPAYHAHSRVTFVGHVPTSRARRGGHKETTRQIWRVVGWAVVALSQEGISRGVTPEDNANTPGSGMMCYLTV